MKANDDLRIIEGLRSHSYKVTPQRLAICRLVLVSRGQSQTANIFEQVREARPTVSPATAYKTPSVLRAPGMVQELCLIRVQTRFDSRMEPHINMICRSCGAIEDCTDAPLQDKASELARNAGLLDAIQQIDVHGLCPRCPRSIKSK